MRPFAALFAIALLAGCAPKTETTTETTTTTQASTPASGGPTPMAGGAAGGLTPMSGSESVEGAGSGVNSSAMDAAHRAAAKVGGAPSAGAGDVGGE